MVLFLVYGWLGLHDGILSLLALRQPPLNLAKHPNSLFS